MTYQDQQDAISSKEKRLRRDQFACAALTGLLANIRTDKSIEMDEEVMLIIASHALALADAMIAADKH